jgi:hypothetical protein
LARPGGKQARRNRAEAKHHGDPERNHDDGALINTPGDE